MTLVREVHRRKTYGPIVDTVDGMSMLDREEQLWNALPPIVVKPDGSSTLASEVHPLNVSVCSLVTDVPLRSMLVSDVQPLNAELPIIITFEGMSIFDNDVQFINE